MQVNNFSSVLNSQPLFLIFRLTLLKNQIQREIGEIYYYL